MNGHLKRLYTMEEKAVKGVVGRKQSKMFRLKVTLLQMNDPILEVEGVEYTPSSIPEEVLRSGLLHPCDEMKDVLSHESLDLWDRWYILNYGELRKVKWKKRNL
jgi:hypothetical protein